MLGRVLARAMVRFITSPIVRARTVLTMDSAMAAWSLPEDDIEVRVDVPTVV